MTKLLKGLMFGVVIALTACGGQSEEADAGSMVFSP
jgi:hypothetical protein